ncbi:TetR family transcriptional regulator [Aeromicrobium sp. A1-2]|uniref:TetR/AcrR family transcriptional regulator n=1 Tax=Aeromicrobium sp. A1-2 TaxID=2107713 RepID=UPI000E51CCF5|nr:TetR/AcrR family transcriptional regulator [Aeromicrobium sp. A1-2]AXT84384.1 TetR family transcriptional regulator [Aeromicrobium sp. A1-2]
MSTQNDRLEKAAVDKFARRREQLAASALATLAERGYARTGLRDIAQNSEFSHGVLHYYFKDKDELIQHCVRQYKSDCATHYDEIVATASTADELTDQFAEAMSLTLRDDASMHRLWYDLRNQSMFQAELRPLIDEIDDLLEQMIWNVVTRCAELSDSSVDVESALAYAMYDGMFEQSLMAFLAGDLGAMDAVVRRCRRLMHAIVS